MNTSRRDFLGALGAAGAFTAMGGCCSLCNCGPKGKIAVQLYSLHQYIAKNGLIKTLKDVSRIGYTGVEFAGYWDFSAAEIKKLLGDNGLTACGTHLSRWDFAPENIQKTIDFNLAYGNNYLCCPGGGNIPEGCGWDGKGIAKLDDMKKLCDFYNAAAETAAKSGCYIGLHNHMWEFQVQTEEKGVNYWDYFFSHTDPRVQMEQDVGWTTCAGFKPWEQWTKYPHRSLTLHAKENGMGPNVKEFDAILGQPGKPGAVPVDWDKVLAGAEADGVKWWVVECERHFDELTAVTPSYQFLKSKGLN